MVASELGARGRGIGVLGAAVAAAGALTNALGYVVPVLGARRLSAADLGALATVLAIAAIAGVPGLGLQIAVAVHRARHPGAPTGRVGWLTAAVCAAAVVVLTPIAGALLDLPAAVTLSLAVYTAAVVVAGRWLGELQGDERFLRLALGMVVLAAGRYGGLIAGLLLGAGLTGSVLIGTAVALLIPPALARLARGHAGRRRRRDHRPAGGHRVLGDARDAGRVVRRPAPGPAPAAGGRVRRLRGRDRADQGRDLGAAGGDRDGAAAAGAG